MLPEAQKTERRPKLFSPAEQRSAEQPFPLDAYPFSQPSQQETAFFQPERIFSRFS